MPLYAEKQYNIAQHLHQRQRVCEHCDGANDHETLSLWSYTLTLHIPGGERGWQCQAWQHYCCTEEHAWQAQLACTEQHLKLRWEGKTLTEDEQQITVPVVCDVCHVAHPASEGLQFILALAHTGHPAISGFRCEQEHIACSWEHFTQALETCHQHILAQRQQGLVRVMGLVVSKTMP